MKVRATVGLAGLCLIVLIAAVTDGGEDRAAGGGEGRGLLEVLAESLPVDELALPPEPPASVPGPRFVIASVRAGEEIEVRDRPGGDVIERLGDRTEFGSLRNFWVAKIEGDWLAVPIAELPNGRLGWIRDDPEELRLFETAYSVRADISERRLELRYGRRVLEGVRVTVGAPGSPTPPGKYAITDGLAGDGVGPYYGCCILALTGHQPNLPPDWLGGDRIAIHGSPGEVGIAASAGCLRARDIDMVSLFARLPLGAPVFIRR